MLAIVIPYYKITFLKETLDSLKRQSNKNFHVYIGDDASPEDPSLLIKSFVNELKITYVRFNKNLGGISLIKQWERCIDLTREEEWVMILGDDDSLENNTVEEWYRNYAHFTNKTNVVRFSTQFIEGSKKSSQKFYHPRWESIHDFYERKHFYKTRSSLSEYIFRKRAFLKYRFYNYPLGWYSDDRAWFEFSEGNPIYTINEAIVYIGLSDQSISGRKDLVIPKAKARINFYGFLIQGNYSYFSRSFRIILLRAYEQAILDLRKIKASEFTLLLFYYIKTKNFREIKKFLSRSYHRFLN